jgi:hypothetical protein
MPEGDPDALLEAFETITAHVRRPLIPAPRVSRVPRFAVAIVLVVLISLLAGAAVVYGPRLRPSAGGERIQLPTHRDLNAYPAALLSGQLVREGNCVYVRSQPGSVSDLVVWPSGTSLLVTGNETLIVGRGGERIAAIGEPIELGGGEFELAHTRTLLETEIPDECVGPYWLASSARSTLAEPRTATWRLMPVEPVNQDTTEISLMITEQDCDYGVRLQGAVEPPQIEYRSDAVVVTVSVRSAGGECPGDENSFKVATLDQPVGDRQLIDGGDNGIEWQPQLGLIALPQLRFPGVVCYPTYLEDAFLAGDVDDPSVAWVVSAEGQRVNVLWPEGYAARFVPDVELIGPIGQLVARSGELLTLGGGFLPTGEFETCGGVHVGHLDLGGGDPMPWPTQSPSASDPPTRSPDPSPTTRGSLFVTTWRLDDAVAVGPDSTDIHILIAQKACVFDLESVGQVFPPEITYLDDAVLITARGELGFDVAACRSPQPAIVPALVQLDQPIGTRTLRDGGLELTDVRWRVPPADAILLPAARTEPFALGRPVGGLGVCAGIGFDNSVLTGDPADPRLVWVGSASGDEFELLWPPGFTVTFRDGFEVRNEAGEIVHRDGDAVEGGCVVGRDGELSLYGDGYAVLD